MANLIEKLRLLFTIQRRGPQPERPPQAPAEAPGPEVSEGRPHKVKVEVSEAPRPPARQPAASETPAPRPSAASGRPASPPAPGSLDEGRVADMLKKK